MIVSHLKYGANFCAIEHSLVNDSLEVIYALQLKKSKRELSIIKKAEFSTKNDLIKQLKNQNHLFLVLNNQHVLLKSVEHSQLELEKVVKLAYPTIKLLDFYYEIIQSKEQYFVAICRKEYVDNLIKEYQSLGVYVIGFSLHNLTINSLLPYVDSSELNSSNNTIYIKNKKLDKIVINNTVEKEYSINNLQITNKFILALSGALSYINPINNRETNFRNKEIELKENYLNVHFFKLGIKSALGIIFLILLINFIYFSSAYKEMTNLNLELLVKGDSKNSLIQLQNRVQKKEALSKNINSLSTSKVAWYLNELGKSVPSKLQLDFIKYQPLIRSVKNNKEIETSQNRIVVNGVSRSNISFSNWIAGLELEKWIEKINIISYGKGKKAISEFEFIINIKR